VIGHATANAILARLSRALAPPEHFLLPLRVGTAHAGWLDEQRAARLAGFVDVFAVNSDGVSFLPSLHNESSRSKAVAGVTATLAAEGALTKWRDELYAAAPAFGAPPWFLLERAAARYFGVHTWAAHINGVVRGPPKAQMWFARRSEGKAIDPLKLDNLVGGGIAAGATAAETLAKEAWEEAGIRGELATRAQPAGAVHIWREQPDGLQSETIFVNDLWLPGDFTPANQDGEAIEHRRVEMDDAARLIALAEGPDEVTADASLVVLDFLLRQGAVDAASPAFGRLKALRNTHAAARRA
jgi:8-oxo-dGTP pyrophosphatase MutT (NUDIX family)